MSELGDYARAGGFAGPYLRERLGEELLAICRGLLMDGALVDREIVQLDRWCHANPMVVRTWPGDVIVDRLHRALADGVIDEDERRDLHLLMEEMTGYKNGHQCPGSDIYTAPPPEMVIIDEVFTLTGVFLFGPRTKVKTAIEEIGGHVIDNVREKTNYLLVGSRSSPAWLETQYGKKIGDAIDINARRERSKKPIIPIVAEAHWSRYLMKPDDAQPPAS